MIRWINSNTAVINGGNRFKFVGIIRGQGHPPITYFGNSVEEITEGLNLAEWVYYIKEVSEMEYCNMCEKFTEDLVERKSGDLFCRECHEKYCEHLNREEALVGIDEKVVYCLDCLQEVKGGY